MCVMMFTVSGAGLQWQDKTLCKGEQASRRLVTTPMFSSASTNRHAGCAIALRRGV